jgi:type VI secretion system protein ImpK
VPVWVVAVLGVAIVSGLFIWFSGSLNAKSDDLFARMLADPPNAMPTITRAVAVVPPPPPPPAPGPQFLDTLRTFLAPEIKQGLVAVLGTEQAPLVRIRNRGLFGSGRAVVESGFIPLLQRIGEALKTEKGHVTVIGYTDNQPIHTVQFPSNFQLSTARAEAAKAIIAKALGDPSRITAEGRADADPVASNATPEGREANRRIEVLLQRQGN